jgi:hypothetical protein
MTDRIEQNFVDYDVHGLVGIRLIHPSEANVAAVGRQTGFSPTQLSREPDIIIRFTGDLPAKNLRLLGLNQAAFTDDGFFVLGKGKRSAKVKIPFDQIGSRCEIVCESRVLSIPLLIPILNLTLLSKGFISLHASAFVLNQVGILVTGWAKGGKTEALFAFANNGGQYLGDEWIILSADGQRMYGIPEPIRLWDWHLDYLPHIAGRLRLEDRLLFKAIRILDKLNQLISRSRLQTSPPAKFLNKAMPALRRQLNVTIPPSEIFGCNVLSSAKPEKLFFLISHQDESYHAEPADPREITQRMMASILYEQLPFMAYYKAFKFAFPGRRNSFLENVEQLANGLLISALEGKEAYQILHPYPVSFPALYEMMLQYCEAKDLVQPISSFASKPVLDLENPSV